MDYLREPDRLECSLFHRWVLVNKEIKRQAASLFNNGDFGGSVFFPSIIEIKGERDDPLRQTINTPTWTRVF